VLVGQLRHGPQHASDAQEISNRSSAWRPRRTAVRHGAAQVPVKGCL